MNKRELIKVVWDCKAKTETDWLDVQESAALRLFYTFKAIVCIALGLEGDVDEYVVMGSYGFKKTYSYNDGPGADWDDLIVGRGLLRDWRYTSRGNGYP